MKKNKNVFKYDNEDYEDSRSAIMASFDEEKIDEGFTKENVEKLATILHKLRESGIAAIDVWESNQVNDYLTNLTAEYKNKKAKSGKVSKKSDKIEYDESDYEDSRSAIMASFDEEEIDEGFTKEDVEKLATIVCKLRKSGMAAIDVWESNQVNDYLTNLTAEYKNKKSKGGKVSKKINIKPVRKIAKKAEPARKATTKKTDTNYKKGRFTVEKWDIDILHDIDSEFLVTMPFTYHEIVKKLGEPSEISQPSVEGEKTYFDKIVFEWVLWDTKTESYIKIADAYKYAQSLEEKNITFEKYKNKKMDWEIRGDSSNPLSIYAMISLKRYLEGKDYKESDKELLELFKSLKSGTEQKQQDAMRNVEKEHSKKSSFLTPVLAGIALITGVLIGKNINK